MQIYSEKGQYIYDHLSSVNLEPWHIIDEKYVNPTEKLKNTENKFN